MPIAFADDIVYVVTGNSRRDLEGRGAAICGVLAQWATEAKMKIAGGKTKGLMVKGRLQGRPPAIRLRADGIQFVSQVKCLGVTLDTNLTFIPHVKIVGDKAKALFGKLTRLVRIKYGVKTSRLNFLYKTVYVTIVSYGFRVWRHRLQHSHVINNIKETQRKILLHTFGAYCTASL